MPFERRVLHYDTDALTLIQTLNTRAMSDPRSVSMWFELLRQGGCGAGELVLKDKFATLRDDIEIGDYIAAEYEEGDRWYLGRVEDVVAESPKGVRLQLFGMFAELSEVFPGALAGMAADNPQRYANSDYFVYDPDHAEQVNNVVSGPEQVITQLYTQYISPNTNVTLGTIDPPRDPRFGIDSLVLRGEESAAAIIRMLCVYMRGHNFGVNEQGELFVTQRDNTVIATFQEGLDLESLVLTSDRTNLYNRIMLTGGYVYESDFYWRYRANFRQIASANRYGDRNARIFLPWVRTNNDAIQFIKEFFRIYAIPNIRCSIKTVPQTTRIPPWSGLIRVNDVDGTNIVTNVADKIRIDFNHAPIFSMEVGPEDLQFPQENEDQRWEVGPTAMPGPSISSLPTLTVGSGTSASSTSASSTSASSTSASSSSASSQSLISTLLTSSGGPGPQCDGPCGVGVTPPNLLLTLRSSCDLDGKQAVMTYREVGDPERFTTTFELWPWEAPLIGCLWQAVIDELGWEVHIQHDQVTFAINCGGAYYFRPANASSTCDPTYWTPEGTVFFQTHDDIVLDDPVSTFRPCGLCVEGDTLRMEVTHLP